MAVLDMVNHDDYKVIMRDDMFIAVKKKGNKWVDVLGSGVYPEVTTGEAVGYLSRAEAERRLEMEKYADLLGD